MKPTMEILFDCLKETLGTREGRRLSYPEFQEELKKDKTMREGVKAIVKAMDLHTKLTLEEQKATESQVAHLN